MDDNSYLITYLRDKLSFTISEADYDGNTPLHYACYNNSEYASFWLIGFGSDVNALNKTGDTPMHLLIKADNKLYNTKTVRELIFKGARRDIKIKKGELASDLLNRLEDEKLKSELEKILGDQPCYLPCFHVKQPLKKIENS